jgi:type IV fimbrial biogenesis protein FimT
MSRTHQGFSMIELMVTMVILGILVVAAVPGFSAWLANSRVRSVAEAMAADMLKAKNEASHRSHQIAFVRTAAAPTTATAAASTSGDKWYLRVNNLVPGELSTDSAMDGGGFLVRGETLAAQYGVSISGPAMICFSSSGRLVANTTTTSDGFVLNCAAPTVAAPATFNITRTGADRPLRLTVALGGMIRMCDPAKTLSATAPDGC